MATELLLDILKNRTEKLISAPYTLKLFHSIGQLILIQLPNPQEKIDVEASPLEAPVILDWEHKMYGSDHAECRRRRPSNLGIPE